MNIQLFTLTSSLHDPQALQASTESFLGTLFPQPADYTFRGEDFSAYGSGGLDVIHVRTGGTEGRFRELLPALLARSGKAPFILLTSGKNNSLAAAMEILSFLHKQGLSGEILHGQTAYIRGRLAELSRISAARQSLRGKRYGVIGNPSDWLIASQFDERIIQERLGIELIGLPMEELLSTLALTPESSAPIRELADAPAAVRSAWPEAQRIYFALKAILAAHRLDGCTVRCFDLLSAVGNTGCLALARLNAEGYVAGCEGDVPAMLSMALVRSLCGISGFQANPAQIDPDSGEVVFAHCTIPLDMVTRFSLDTHFESGLGVAIRGHFQEGPVTVFKVSGDLQRHFIAEGSLLRNPAQNDLCRTQVLVRLTPQAAQSFLTDPIGNHHIILPGHQAEALSALLR